MSRFVVLKTWEWIGLGLGAVVAGVVVLGGSPPPVAAPSAAWRRLGRTVRLERSSRYRAHITIPFLVRPFASDARVKSHAESEGFVKVEVTHSDSGNYVVEGVYARTTPRDLELDKVPVISIPEAWVHA